MLVYDHPAPSPALSGALKASLPYSISLVYRTQHRNRTQYAHILTTIPPSDNLAVPKCWAAAYFDRSVRPETELWIFAAGELPGHSSSERLCAECKKAILLLLDHISTLPVPPLRPDNENALEMAYQHEREHPEPGPDGRYPPSPGSYMRHLLSPSVITLGACHEQVVQICRDYGLVRKEFPGEDAILNKFLFKIGDLPHTRELPGGLQWGEMRRQDIDIVRARTNIPRPTETLLSLNSVGVFDTATDRAVAWTFLGLDGSLTTLHTEEDYRGKGIAKAVAARTISKYAPGSAVDSDGNAWSHADVYVGNVQSESVCRSLGGQPLWRHFWVRIDLGKAGTLTKNE